MRDSRRRVIAGMKHNPPLRTLGIFIFNPLVSAQQFAGRVAHYRARHKNKTLASLSGATKMARDNDGGVVGEA